MPTEYNTDVNLLLKEFFARDVARLNKQEAACVPGAV